jgi:aromatic-L-amino-acid/L-tryptophan decarboxylase
MQTRDALEALRSRKAPLEMSPEEFRAAGYRMVDAIAAFLDSLRARPVTPGETPGQVRRAFADVGLPEEGTPPDQLLDEIASLMVEHSLFNGHPRFWGYITASAAPIGALADLLVSSINPNLAAWVLSPLASEIEGQTIRWIAELIGYPTTCGGLMVSGGNAANFVGFLAARSCKLGRDVRTGGVGTTAERRPRVYCSAETHTWIEKAADQYGIGTDGIRWIPVNEKQQMDLSALRTQIERDKEAGDTPFLVVGNAGSTGVGAMDGLSGIAEICRTYDLWFHVDAAYGGFAACLPDAPPELAGLGDADSVAVDPHKWLYSALEAGCALVRDPEDLVNTFSYHPSYYKVDEATKEAGINYYEYGPQNSRGFRALRVWLALRQVGRQGYAQMIAEDIQLAAHLFDLVEAQADLQAHTQNLSVTTFRYVPSDLAADPAQVEPYLNRLNEDLLVALQKSGEAFVSNAVVRGTYLLRACVVNFRTSLEDIEALPEIVSRIGQAIDAALRPAALRRKA